MKQQMRKYISLLLALILCVGLFAVSTSPASAVEAEGTCGENVTWTLANGMLTIAGEGAMDDYSEFDPAPWYEHREQIQQVKILNGVTAVGDLSFYQCTKLTMATLSDSVKFMGDMAFLECTSLSRVVMPGVEEIGMGCFYSCTSLQNVILPECLLVIGDKAFYNCQSLGGITIPASVKYLGSSAFCYCINMVYAKVLADIDILPHWVFYGCDLLWQLYLPESIGEVQENALGECGSLYHVEYSGSEEVKEEIQNQLDQDTTNKEDPSTFVGVEYTETEGAVITVTSTVDYNATENGGEPYETTIEATITDTSGWSDLVDVINSTNTIDGSSPDVEVVLLDDVGVDGAALEQLVATDVVITIHTSDNTSWEVVLEDQTKETLNVTQVFSVLIKKNISNIYSGVLGDAVSYTVTLGQTGLNSTIMLPLGREAARQVATLYAINGKELVNLCSVIVDDDGKAAFCLAGTTPGDYILALNVQGIDSSEVRIPQKLAGDYGDGTLMDIYGNKYIVTGVTNPLGFGVGTLTLIIVGVLVGSALIVGAVMTMWNKQRKKAYAGMHAEQSNQEASPDSGTRKRNTRFFVRQSEGNASGKAPENAENEEIASTLEEKTRRRRENSANNGRMKFHRKKR